MPYMSVSLENERVLVAGASSGIGRATAVLFAHAGARVVASARRDDRLRELRKAMAGEGRSLEIVAADAGDPADMERLAETAARLLGGVDILVYATGTNIPDRALTRLTREIWNMMIQVNLNGAYYLTRALLPAMRAARKGHLIYVSSISGKVPDISGAAYQAAKRGLLGLAHAIRVEEKDNGIRTCVVCPGLVRTELIDKRPMKTPDEVLAKAMEPEDVAEIILDVARLHPRAAVPELEILPTYL